MGANIPRRNHYIPVFLQNNFCDIDGRIWVGDKCQPGPFHTSPTNVFVVGNLYATDDYVQPVKTYENEAALQRIEDAAKPAISAIIEQARLGCPPLLSREDNDRFKRFIVAQARRTPEAQERTGLAADVDDIFRVAATEVLKRGGYSVPEEEWFDQDPIVALKQKYKSNLVGNFASGAHHLLEEDTKRFCSDTGWLAATIEIPERSFVFGSHGITIVDHGGRLESWLPIAHDVAINVTPNPNETGFLRLGRHNEAIIRTINQSTVARSRFIAGRSKGLIQSLMSRYWSCWFHQCVEGQTQER